MNRQSTTATTLVLGGLNAQHRIPCRVQVMARGQRKFARWAWSWRENEGGILNLATWQETSSGTCLRIIL
jgi:hypothetical protein